MIRLASFVERFTLLAGLAVTLPLVLCLGYALAVGTPEDQLYWGGRFAVALIVALGLAVLNQVAMMIRELSDQSRRAEEQGQALARLTEKLATYRVPRSKREEYRLYLEDESGVLDPRR